MLRVTYYYTPYSTRTLVSLGAFSINHQGKEAKGAVGDHWDLTLVVVVLQKLQWVKKCDALQSFNKSAVPAKYYGNTFSLTPQNTAVQRKCDGVGAVERVGVRDARMREIRHHLQRR